ncbi:MAG: PAS domain S-box protein, partial [Pyrinomonadaceae bacterium]
DESAEFFADDLKVLESGKPKLGYEEMLPGGNGDKRWVQTDKVPYFDSDGKPIGIIVMAQDVTERKNAEEALRESEENFRQLAENINDSFWIRSPDLNEIHYISPAFEKIWGRSLESVNATPHEWLNFILPEDREHVREAYERLMGSAPTIDIEYRIVRADDEVRWVRTRGFQVRNEDGELIRLAGIVTDITESKKAIEALGESEERYRELVENAIDVIYTLDLKGNYTSINRASVGLTGYTVEESLSRNIVESMAPEYREKARQLLEAQIHGEDLSAFELEIIAKDGRRIALELKTRPIIENGVPVGVQGIARDVTERKVAREQLEQSSAQLRIAGQAAHLGGWSIELPERTLTWTDENCRIHDVEPGYVPTLDESVETYYSEHRDEVMGYVNDCAENGTPYDLERPIITAKGRHIWVRVIGEAVRDEDGKIVRLQGAIQDITDRKQAEEALRQKESLIRIAGELTRTGGWAVELPTNQVFWSDEISDILELPRGEIPELERALELYPQSSRDKVVAGLEACSKDGTPLDIEVEIDTATGRRIWVRVCAEADRKVDGTITRIQGAFQDISERKGIESQLRQAQKLESVGLLAGGIAHDFNNMLTAITGYSELTLRRMAEDDPLRGNLIEIKNAGDRSAALTNQLLAFSRQQILQPEVVVINQIIAETVNMLGRLIGENIQLVTILNPKVGQVKADPGQLSQILTNLAVNARDAMPDGGKLTFETSNAFLEDEYAGRQVDVLPGAYVMFAVSDTGTGMDVETQEHIFEPFYTTKGVGKGTGLGLATVYGIVKQSNGHILVYSEPGMGTTFKIYLPRVVDDSEKAETARTSDKLPIGTETILLVEDEEMVRKFTRQTLEMCGYTVIEAGNGSDALAIFESDPGRVNLVMADIVMPGMGGRELAEKISLSWPEMPVLFTSGYTDDAVVRHGVVNSDANFIQKPFATDALARKVRDIFDGVEKA